MRRRTFGAIDVGSSALTMKIMELGSGGIRQLDCISRDLDIGSDTYNSGKISPAKMEELCRTLKEFSGIMAGYQVASYKAYGTSAIRETENTNIILDQIWLRTGIRVEMLSNSEQRFLDYKSIASKGEMFHRVIEDATAIVDIGGGSIQISLFENGVLTSTQNLRLGVLRIQERIGHLNAGSTRFETMVDEWAAAQLAIYQKLYAKGRTIKNLIVVDDYLSPWVQRRQREQQELVPVEEYTRMREGLRGKPAAEIAGQMNIPEERVPLVYISAILIDRIARLLGGERVWIPGATLCDGIAYEYAEKNKLLRLQHDFEKDIMACTMNISKRYMGSRKREEALEKMSLTIFDSMYKVHGLGKRERLYLRIAALLHDCGKYISLINIGESSYNIILATEIIGLSHMEREIVANIVRFNHSPFLYYDRLKSQGSGLDRPSYLIVAKLTAILQLANSLDRSHKQKLVESKASLKEGRLVLTVDTMEDISLEREFFEIKVPFFQEVFNIEPLLRQRRRF